MKSWYWKSVAALSTAWCGYCAAIALRTPSAFAQSPAVSPENKPVIIMRTAGQSDRRLQVIQQTNYANGESLAEVRDLKTGKIFTLPGKMIALMAEESANNRAEEPAPSAEKSPPVRPVVPTSPAALAQPQLAPEAPKAPQIVAPVAARPVAPDLSKIAPVANTEQTPAVAKPWGVPAPTYVRPAYVAQSAPEVAPAPRTPVIQEQCEIKTVATETTQSIATMRWRPIDPSKARQVFHPILEKIKPKPEDRWKPISESR